MATGTIKNRFIIETLNYSNFNTTNFELATWGNIYVTKCGPICLIGVSGLRAKTDITSNTALCKLPITARSAALIPMLNSAEMFIQKDRNTLYIVNMKSGVTTSGQIAIITDF